MPGQAMTSGIAPVDEIATGRACTFASCADVDGLSKYDISCEAWREYDFGSRRYRVHNPVALYTRVGGTTHRVVDADGITHCCPIPGTQGCVLRWKNKEGCGPVQF